jgi:hypothetical protein
MARAIAISRGVVTGSFRKTAARIKIKMVAS